MVDTSEDCELFDGGLAEVVSIVPAREDPNHALRLSPAPAPAPGPVDPSLSARASRQDDKLKLDRVDEESLRFGKVAAI